MNISAVRLRYDGQAGESPNKNMNGFRLHVTLIAETIHRAVGMVGKVVGGIPKVVGTVR